MAAYGQPKTLVDNQKLQPVTNESELLHIQIQNQYACKIYVPAGKEKETGGQA